MHSCSTNCKLGSTPTVRFARVINYRRENNQDTALALAGESDCSGFSAHTISKQKLRVLRFNLVSKKICAAFAFNKRYS